MLPKIVLKRPSTSRPRLATSLDLDRLVFDHDRAARAEMMKDDDFARVVRDGAAAMKQASAPRRELLKTAIRLTPKMAPGVVGNVEHCARRLGIAAPIEVFCFQDAVMNAFCTPPDRGTLTIGMSSSLVERLDDAELRFVIGHEIGHLLFDHVELGPWLLEGEGALTLAPIHAMQLFAWMRYAELSADRVGLVCSGDFAPAARAFFKLTSGLTDPRLVAECDECTAQYAAVHEGAGAEGDPADWYSTHPYNPLRVTALDLFARSKTFAELTGGSGGELSEAELEAAVKRLVGTMEPAYLQENPGCGDEVREFLALAGLLVASIDGEVAADERAALGQILGDDAGGRDLVARLEKISPDEADARLSELSSVLTVKLSALGRHKLVEDLCVIALADRRVDETEVQALEGLAEVLEVDPGFVAQTLSAPARALD